MNGPRGNGKVFSLGTADQGFWSEVDGTVDWDYFVSGVRVGDESGKAD
jgi:hypothetical protein